MANDVSTKDSPDDSQTDMNGYFLNYLEARRETGPAAKIRDCRNRMQEYFCLGTQNFPQRFPYRLRLTARIRFKLRGNELQLRIVAKQLRLTILETGRVPRLSRFERALWFSRSLDLHIAWRPSLHRHLRSKAIAPSPQFTVVLPTREHDNVRPGYHALCRVLHGIDWGLASPQSRLSK